ncbi:MAG: twin-arginine translocase TatA/TatE family subunit [Deltaproteobacteria bacterium]|nr:twin-arginine translocase TatA/TatE family subunit [Deltaproteobacteria bacterium]
MFGMGGSEIIVILIVALLFLGPDKLPSAAKQISKGIRDIKKQSRSLQQQIEGDEQIGGAIRDLKSALRGDDVPVQPRQIKPKKKKELQAPENTIAAPDAIAAEPAELPAPAPAEGALAEADEPGAPKVTLPATAGEADADVPPASAEADEELASLIRPAAGTVAKGSEPKHG